MHVISLKPLKDFYEIHKESKPLLLSLYKALKETDFGDFGQLRAAFPQVDYVKPFCVFNVGRAFRVIAAVHFNRRKVFIRHVLTHREYDLGKWKEK